MTLTKTADPYVVHELLKPGDPTTPCHPAEVLHSSEHAGQDIYCDDDGFWRSITQSPGAFGPVYMDAGPILHRGKLFIVSSPLIYDLTPFYLDPCLGFVVRESVEPFRKIVILGDTHDPLAIAPLCIDPSPSLLIHEATDAFIPTSVDPRAKRSKELVKQKTEARGHSSPDMAGLFARTVGAQKLVQSPLQSSTIC